MYHCFIILSIILYILLRIVPETHSVRPVPLLRARKPQVYPKLVILKSADEERTEENRAVLKTHLQSYCPKPAQHNTVRTYGYAKSRHEVILHS